jgi:putative toxin-antitoxin system antitoxin component (TIGR02293 family)
MRNARLFRLATDTFGSEKKAKLWLEHGHRLLGGRKPIDVARIKAGALLMEEMLTRTAWGSAL